MRRRRPSGWWEGLAAAAGARGKPPVWPLQIVTGWRRPGDVVFAGDGRIQLAGRDHLGVLRSFCWARCRNSYPLAASSASQPWRSSRVKIAFAALTRNCRLGTLFGGLDEELHRTCEIAGPGRHHAAVVEVDDLPPT